MQQGRGTTQGGVRRMMSGFSFTATACLQDGCKPGSGDGRWRRSPIGTSGQSGQAEYYKRKQDEVNLCSKCRAGTKSSARLTTRGGIRPGRIASGRTEVNRAPPAMLTLKPDVRRAGRNPRGPSLTMPLQLLFFTPGMQQNDHLRGRADCSAVTEINDNR